MLKHTTVRETVQGHGVKCLVYGAAGVGKTVLCGTMPNTCIISTENGLLPLSMEESTANLPVMVVSSAKDLEEAFKECSSQAFRNSFDSVCLDSVSDIAEAILTDEKKKVNDPRQAYGSLGDMMFGFIRKFRDLQGLHVLFTAKQEREKDESGKMYWGPMMPGKMLTQNLDYFFDEVFAMGTGRTPPPGNEEYRFLRTRHDLQFRAKDRSKALEDFEYPDMNNIINKILTAIAARNQ